MTGFLKGLLSLGIAFTILGLTVALAGGVEMRGEWVPMTAPLNEQEPEIVLLSSNDELIELEMNLPGIYRELVNTPGGDYARLFLPLEGFTSEIGRPQLPVMLRWVEVPYDARIELEVEEAEFRVLSLEELDLDRPIAPVQRPVPKIPGAREAVEFEMDEDFYARDGWYPQEPVERGEEDYSRGRHLVLLKIHPVRYNPHQGTVSICTRLRLRMTLRDSDLQETRRRVERWRNGDLRRMMRRQILNFDRYADKVVPGLPIGYLIIVDDNYYSQILPLAQWKEQKGFQVTVTQTSEISPLSASGIKAYIQDAYDNWAVPPSYVLLVGDTGDIPPFYGSSSSTETDLPYSDMEGTYFPELEVGRFSVSSTSEATAIVNKVLDYEKTDLASLDWFDDAVFMASLDNYSISEGTHNWVIDNYMTPNGYTSTKIYARLGGGTSDITSNINAGRSIANYSGHGNQVSWSNPGFGIANINALTNADKYPFVISNACLTTDIGYGECYGEHWVNVAAKGAIAHWGSSNYTYWNEDDILEKRMYRAIFDDEIYTLAGFTNQAKYYHYQYYSGGGLSRYYYECYLLIGDPSVMLPTDIPTTLSVDHPVTVPLGPSDVSVVVVDSSPVNEALVCLMQDGGIHEVAYTDASGEAVLSISPSTTDEILLTVTAHNCRPYQRGITPVEANAPPSAVNDLTIILAQAHLSLDWSAVTTDTLANPKTVTEYVIYRGDSPDFVASPASSLGTTTDTEYLDMTAAVGDTTLEHCYLVLAVDEGGQKSEPSNLVGEFDRPTVNDSPTPK
jgi:hypothetical protein